MHLSLEELLRIWRSKGEPRNWLETIALPTPSRSFTEDIDVITGTRNGIKLTQKQAENKSEIYTAALLGPQARSGELPGAKANTEKEAGNQKIEMDEHWLTSFERERTNRANLYTYAALNPREGQSTLEREKPQKVSPAGVNNQETSTTEYKIQIGNLYRRTNNNRSRSSIDYIPEKPNWTSGWSTGWTGWFDITFSDAWGGKKLYWDIGGVNITNEDFGGNTHVAIGGTSYGESVLTGAGSREIKTELMTFSFHPKRDGKPEGNETIEISFYSDPKHQHKIGEKTIVILENHAPYQIVLSTLSVDENTEKGTAISSMYANDVDDRDHVFSLFDTGDEESRDNEVFKVEGDKLLINDVPDFEAKESYNICIDATDSDGSSYKKAFTIEVNDKDELTSYEKAGKVELFKDPLGYAYARENWWVAPSKITDRYSRHWGDNLWENWTIVGAEKINGVKTSAWEHDDGRLYFSTHGGYYDDQWYETGSGGFAMPNTSQYWQSEVAFSQDFNKDTLIGNPDNPVFII